MRVLVACENDQITAREFRSKGHETYSCNLKECPEESEWHIQGDLMNVMNANWDLIIAFPPYTHICFGGAAWTNVKINDGRLIKAAEFFIRISEADCKRICIGNPMSLMNTIWRVPDQKFHSIEFNDRFSRKISLWLKNLPLLRPTNPEDINLRATRSVRLNVDERNKFKYERTRFQGFFPGIAKAMSEQWNEESFARYDEEKNRPRVKSPCMFGFLDSKIKLKFEEKTKNEEQFETIRKIVELKKKGNGILAVIRKLNEQGYRYKNGEFFNRYSVDFIIRKLKKGFYGEELKEEMKNLPEEEFIGFKNLSPEEKKRRRNKKYVVY